MIVQENSVFYPLEATAALAGSEDTAGNCAVPIVKGTDVLPQIVRAHIILAQLKIKYFYQVAGFISGDSDHVPGSVSGCQPA